MHILCSDGKVVTVPRCTMEHVSVMWREATPADGVQSVFAEEEMLAFLSLCKVGSPDPPPRMTARQMHAALRPAYAYRADGVKRHILKWAERRREFRSAEEEEFLQKVLLYVDGRGDALPPAIVRRLAKTVSRCSWPEVPYMWTVAAIPEMSGFPLYRLSVRLIVRLIRMSKNDNLVCTSISCISLRHKMAVRIQGLYRRRGRGLGSTCRPQSC